MLFWIFKVFAILLIGLAPGNAANAANTPTPTDRCTHLLAFDAGMDNTRATVWLEQQSTVAGLRGQRKGDLNSLEWNNLIFQSTETGEVVLEWNAKDWLLPVTKTLSENVHVHFLVGLHGSKAFAVRASVGEAKTFDLVLLPESRKVINITELGAAKSKVLIKKLHTQFRKEQKKRNPEIIKRSPWKFTNTRIENISDSGDWIIYSVNHTSVGDSKYQWRRHYFVAAITDMQTKYAREEISEIPSAPNESTIMSSGFLFDDQIAYFIMRNGDVYFENIGDSLGPIPNKLSISGIELKTTYPQIRFDSSQARVASADFSPTILLGSDLTKEGLTALGYRFLKNRGWTPFIVETKRRKNQQSLGNNVEVDSSGRFILISGWSSSEKWIEIADLDDPKNFEAISKTVRVSEASVQQINGLSLYSIHPNLRRKLNQIQPTKIVVESVTNNEANAREFKVLDLETGKLSSLSNSIANAPLTHAIQFIGGNSPFELFLIGRPLVTEEFTKEGPSHIERVRAE